MVEGMIVAYANQRELDFEPASRSPLATFFIKVQIVTAAAIFFIFCTSLLIEAQITSALRKNGLLNGGPAFWHKMEDKLIAFADAPPDLPAEERVRIIAALRKISDR